MSLIEGLGQFARELERNKISYGIIGGLAVFAYGGERTTFDVDFLIPGRSKTVVKTIADQLGLKILNENEEVLQLSGAAQIVIFANRPATQSMLERVRRVASLPYPVVAPEDLVGLKIQGFAGDRTREYTDKGDILTILRNVPGLDFTKIKGYADIFNVWNEIVELQKHI